MTHPFVELARKTIEAYVTRQEQINPPAESPPEMQQQAGAFVSLHKKSGQLRGCIGTIEPVQDSLAEEIINNAISAATRDPRFPPLRPDELEDLDISVDVLSPAEPVDSIAELDPQRYGVIVESAHNPYQRGLLLPDLEGVDTAKYQVDIARRKAGISPNAPIKLSRFEVKRYH